MKDNFSDIVFLFKLGYFYNSASCWAKNKGILTVVVAAQTSIGVGTVGSIAGVGGAIAVVELLGSLQVLGGLSGESHGEHHEESEDSKLWNRYNKFKNNSIVDLLKIFRIY